MLSSQINHFRFFFSILGVFFVAAIVMEGCKAPTVDYQVSQFASIRVMDFAWNCQAPMDIYWYGAGQTRPIQANVYNLSYGQASVYTNLLQAGNYNVLVTPHLIPGSSDLQTSVTLLGNQKYSLIVTRPSQSGPFISSLIPDGVANPSPTLAYVRFINLQPYVGALTVHVNDPNTGDLINTVADTFGMVSPYFGLKTALDSSYTFFVTNSKNQIVTRLGYQTFSAGNSYTLVYAGDLCNTVITNPADSTGSPLDTLRLRTFDDNSLGNDLTNPVTASFRFNIVNDIIPIHYDGSPSYYDPTYPTDTTLGFLLNGQGYPESPFYGNTVPPIPAFQGGGENVGVMVNGALEVNYQSALVPIPMVVQAFATNASGSYQQSTFSAGGNTYPLNQGTNVLLTSSGWYKPYTLLFYDTVPTPFAELDTLAPSHFVLIPVTDVSVPNAAIFEFISGTIAQPPLKSSPSLYYSNFWVQMQGDTAIPGPGNAQGGLAVKGYDMITVPMTGSSAVFTVTDSIGQGTKAAPRTFGATSTFTAQAGGIYEIVSMGTKAEPRLLIMHVNN
jgi:hypothetical protein